MDIEENKLLNTIKSNILYKMFEYIQNDKDGMNLYLIFKEVMEKYKNENLSIIELFNIVETRYYIQYIMDEEVNKMVIESEKNEPYDDTICDNDCGGYDGYCGYDN